MRHFLTSLPVTPRAPRRLRQWRSLLGLSLGLWVGFLPLAALANFVPPTNAGLPGRRVGGGTRGCVFARPGESAELLALMPETNVGLTTDESPTFAWYMPRSQARLVRFSLHDADPTQPDQPGTLVYETTLSVAGLAGIASLEFPTTAGLAPLEVGKSYRWSVALICNPNNLAGDVVVTGWLQRVELDPALVTPLETACPRDRADLYAANGYWFDVLETLLHQRRAQPDDEDIQAQWRSLLTDVGLAQLGEAEFLDQRRFEQLAAPAAAEN